jgi:hypothetical protein|tara:strand:+ start:3595 stop:3741 length:147 start_codon:yes stop_codon:yes gene_type:complete
MDFINIHDAEFGFMPQYVSFRNYKISEPKIEQKLMPGMKLYLTLIYAC